MKSRNSANFCAVQKSSLLRDTFVTYAIGNFLFCRQRYILIFCIRPGHYIGDCPMVFFTDLFTL